VKTEKQKMLAGELYNALDSHLTMARYRARELIRELNASKEDDQ